MARFGWTARARSRRCYVRSAAAPPLPAFTLATGCFSINGEPVKKATGRDPHPGRDGTWTKANYASAPAASSSIPSKSSPRKCRSTAQLSTSTWWAAAYLMIGLFVYFRRGSAHKAQHFYVLCLTSFICLRFHYTGQLNSFDQVILLRQCGGGSDRAHRVSAFLPDFPEPRRWLRGNAASGSALPARRPAVRGLCRGQLPAALELAIPLSNCAGCWTGSGCVFADAPYLLGAAGGQPGRTARPKTPLCASSSSGCATASFCGIVPFAALYVLPYAFGALPNEYLKMSVLSLVLLPLTLAYAIVRYRLMDVDILFRRGYAYTLATLCVLAASTASSFRWAAWCTIYFKDLGNTGLMTVMLIGGFPVPAHPHLDSGAAGPLFLPRPLRLPPHAGGVRPRAELGNRPRYHAGARWATGCSQTLSIEPPGFLPGRGGARTPAGDRCSGCASAMGDNPRLAAALPRRTWI